MTSSMPALHLGLLFAEVRDVAQAGLLKDRSMFREESVASPSPEPCHPAQVVPFIGHRDHVPCLGLGVGHAFHEFYV